MKAFAVILKASIGPDYKNQFKEVINPNIVFSELPKVGMLRLPSLGTWGISKLQ